MRGVPISVRLPDATAEWVASRMRVLSRFRVVVDKRLRYVSRRGYPQVSPE